MDVVKLTKRTPGTGGRSAHVALSKDMVRDLEAAGIDTFTVELTEDGILLKPFTVERGLAMKPSWLTPKPAAGEPTRLPTGIATKLAGDVPRRRSAAKG